MNNCKDSENTTKKLWTKDFTCITAATVLSAIGGEAMNLPVSLLIFDETGSAFLAAIIMICGMLPDIILPIFVAPLIDRGAKKRWIVGLDVLQTMVFIGMGFLVSGEGFIFVVYPLFVLITATISVFYRLAYSAWYPDLIPVGAEQKGYAVSSTLYPLVTIAMSPIAAFLYEKIAIENIFFIVAAISAFSVLIENCIREDGKKERQSYTFREYCADMKAGFLYLQKEKGIRNIYTYMGITQGSSEGIALITQFYYQTSSFLNVTMLGFLKSAEMAGRVLSGLFHYKKEIPVKKRFAFTKFVYFFYSLMDILLLFMPYPVMLVNRFVCGGLGTASATIRESAVQSYLPEEMRARVNAFFNSLFALGGVSFQFLTGILAQVIPYRAAAILLSVLTIGSMFFLIVRPKAENRAVYEAVRKERYEKTG
ncbi:MAG: MFS transporter [Ruminococcus sp.]|nr:MFS transporter [Ruminococcus sp.]